MCFIICDKLSSNAPDGMGRSRRVLGGVNRLVVNQINWFSVARSRCCCCVFWSLTPLPLLFFHIDFPPAHFLALDYLLLINSSSICNSCCIGLAGACVCDSVFWSNRDAPSVFSFKNQPESPFVFSAAFHRVAGGARRGPSTTFWAYFSWLMRDGATP